MQQRQRCSNLKLRFAKSQLCLMNTCYLLTGSNLGNRFSQLEQAARMIQAHVGVVVQQSSVYETAPWGNTEQPGFLNQCLEVTTGLNAFETMHALLQIETAMGRMRSSQPWQPRMIDIDLLLFNDEAFTTAALTVPHPRLHERRFALVPLNEIAAEVLHPVFQDSVSRLLEICPDMLSVKKISR
jgi:2-amino-4-hydroxy-6-hydroxymethyldihydropteridine diphosphokinase